MKQLSDLVQSDRVVLFMKGNRRTPQCGFSATVVSILDDLIPSYQTVDVLSDPQIRDGIKEYSQWPTIPQLFIGGEFVGGCDIVKELQASGELQKLLGVTEGEVKTPSIKLSDSAARAFKEAGVDADDEHLRLEVSPRFEYDLSFGPKVKGDIEVSVSGLTICIDRASARRADGISIDYIDDPAGRGGFKIENPNEPPRVKPLSAGDLKAMMDRGEKLTLLDVRTEAERSIAKIEGARHLNQEGQAYLDGLPRDSVLVFHCHHGIRSQSAAEHYLTAGFKTVYNLQGGIEAWSRAVDPSVPRY